MHLDAEKEMMSQCVALLGKFIAVREPNIRYLGLVSCGNTMVLSVKVFSPTPFPPLSLSLSSKATCDRSQVKSFNVYTEKLKFDCCFVTA